MEVGNIKRILVYTHNSIGLGHAFRTLAVITGIKKWRPDIDFLVVSGTSIPQIFFAEGIEVIKLPSIKLDIDGPSNRMSSRYLSSGFELETIFDFRQRLILDSFDFFQPDVLIVEHNMTGQMSELIPILTRKWMRKGGPVDFLLAHICRGIMRWTPILKIPYQNPRHRSESINIGALYDLMYVLEDREVIDINSKFLGNDPELEKKIKYLGKITNRSYDELPTRKQTLSRFGLQDRPIILISLGRKHNVKQLVMRLLDSLEKCEYSSKAQIVIITDPYLEPSIAQELRSCSNTLDIQYLPFVPDLADLIFQSELVISRAGYNTVNEILLTGKKAILIPECHGGGEQELRAESCRREHIKSVSEEEILAGNVHETISNLLTSNIKPLPQKFNKYEIGRTIIQDLEELRANYQICRC